MGSNAIENEVEMYIEKGCFRLNRVFLAAFHC